MSVSRVHVGDGRITGKYSIEEDVEGMIMVLSRYCHEIYVKERRNTAKDLSQDSRCAVRE
jgi:hypothetical protein